MEKKLHIEQVGSDRLYNIFTVDGLSIDEVNQIVTAPTFGVGKREDVLVEIMDKYDNDSTYGKNIAHGWRWGYGIYSIRHVGGHLLVQVGNNCD